MKTKTSKTYLCALVFIILHNIFRSCQTNKKLMNLLWAGIFFFLKSEKKRYSRISLFRLSRFATFIIKFNLDRLRLFTCRQAHLYFKSHTRLQRFIELQLNEQSSQMKGKGQNVHLFDQCPLMFLCDYGFSDWQCQTLAKGGDWQGHFHRLLGEK